MQRGRLAMLSGRSQGRNGWLWALCRVCAYTISRSPASWQQMVQNAPPDATELREFLAAASLEQLIKSIDGGLVARKLEEWLAFCTRRAAAAAAAAAGAGIAAAADVDPPVFAVVRALYDKARKEPYLRVYRTCQDYAA